MGGAAGGTGVWWCWLDVHDWLIDLATAVLPLVDLAMVKEACLTMPYTPALEPRTHAQTQKQNKQAHTQTPYLGGKNIYWPESFKCVKELKMYMMYLNTVKKKKYCIKHTHTHAPPEATCDCGFLWWDWRHSVPQIMTPWTPVALLSPWIPRDGKQIIAISQEPAAVARSTMMNTGVIYRYASTVSKKILAKREGEKKSVHHKNPNV